MSDGKHIVKGHPQKILLSISNKPIKGFVNTLAPSYTFKGEIGKSSSTNGHGIAVDKNGRIWTLSYSDGIRVHNPDGSIHTFAKHPNHIRETITLPNKTELAIKFNRGIATDKDGHILATINNSHLVKFDAQTGDVLRHLKLDCTVTNASTDTLGRIFLASVTGNRQFLLEEDKEKSFNIIKEFSLQNRPKVVRAASITKDGSRIVLPPHSGLKAHVYKASDTEKVNFIETNEILFENNGNSSNAVTSESGSNIYLLVNKAKIGAQLIFRDYDSQLGWTLELKDVDTSDIRGIALNTRNKKLYILSAATGSICVWELAEEI